MQEKKQSVVQIIDRLNVGGAERVVVTLSNILQEHGHKIKVITTVAPGPLVKFLDEGIQHVNLNRKWKWNPLTLYNLYKELREFDIIHVHSAHNLRYVYLAKKMYGLKQTIFFHEHYGARITEKPGWLQKKISEKVVFIGVSEKLRGWAIDQLNINPANAFTLPNTVIKEKNISIRNSDKTNQLVVISNFLPVKNLEFAIDIFASLQKINYPFHATIIGQMADEAYYQRIKAHIAESGLEDAISIITDCSHVQSILPGYDLAIHTSTSESGPISLIECMAQGIPFITYNTGEVVEQVKSKMPLAVMYSFDKEEWVQRIQTLLSMPFDELSSRFASVYDHYFSAEQYYKKCMEIYSPE